MLVKFRLNWGSPPRVRGKVRTRPRSFAASGITPARAGKSRKRLAAVRRFGDHPRACGEKHRNGLQRTNPSGSPPRVRGKVGALNCQCSVDGITPARAGKRSRTKTKNHRHWDHPRACGEKLRVDTVKPGILGSPPRVRGKVNLRGMKPEFVGITPARAGKSKGCQY